MERFVDTHAHIYGEEYAVDVEEVIMRARNAGAEKIFLPATNLTTVEEALSVCQRFPEICYPMLGLHPEDLPSDVDAELSLMETRLQTVHPFIAVGEVGLDYYWDASHKEEQKLLFRQQLQLALELDKPVIIHDREAHGDCFEIVRDYPGLRGVFHCYSGSAEMAKELLKNGWYLGFDGPVTYKNARKTLEVLAICPPERILIETDSPYLSPVPHRGKRNDSRNLRYIVQTIAENLRLEPETVAEITLENGKRLFGIN